MARKIFYDPLCEDIARAFLVDEPDLNTKENLQELAGEIQTAIEGFLEDKHRQRDLAIARGAPR